MQKLTELENPNSVIQLKQWLLENGIEVESFGNDAEEDVQRLINLISQLSKISIKEDEAIERVLCADKRVRGLLQFYSDNRAVFIHKENYRFII